MDVVDLVLSGQQPLAVCGAGYVGLSLAAVYLRHGIKVILADINEEKLRLIESKKYRYIEHTVEEAINTGLDSGRLQLTTSCEEATRKSRITVVTVPIHLDWDTKTINYTPFVNALKDIARGLKKGDLVIIESSVPPGTTEEIAKPVLEETSGLRAEEDFLLAYSPERIYVGRAVKDIEENYPKIVAGIGPRSTEAAAKLYKKIAKKGVLRLPKPRDAEFEKLAEGVYRDVNIALANELAIAAMKLGVDFYAAREAANTAKPYINIHLPGPGVGGACIPIYPYFLANKLLEKHYIPQLMLTARQINEQMPLVIIKLIEQLATTHKIEKKIAKIAILGVAFRGDIDDTRLSPTHDIVALLRARGYNNIWAHDPFVNYDPILNGLGVRLTNNIYDVLDNADIVIIATRHSIYKDIKLSELLKQTGKHSIVIDTVNYIKIDVKYDKIIVLGLR
ncbi:nucleotide sugar dehydrogenase [Pyrodictium abyssi]|uniref:UDP-N-acetyl-D-mannosamine dehydrogenase n=1 Tax=Pyrodictium abyssi TaxID=54256 RepID=A0ABM8IXX1_9CREN|nr:nucleotide sugar dehydrogenase [Pyrodictium abyssi]